MNNCLQCGILTKNRKFCSKKCVGKARVSRNPNLSIDVVPTCSRDYCDNKVRSGSSYNSLCEECYKIYRSMRYMQMTLGKYKEECKRNREAIRSVSCNLRYFAISWNKDLTKLPCAKCGYNKHVEMAHIKPIPDFSDDAILFEISGKQNIIQLCPNCHWEFDNLPRPSS